MVDRPEPGIDEDDDHVDGCVCDLERDDGEATLDVELPAATGGVEAPSHGDAESVDDVGDVEIDEAEVTTDEELPVAIGGVA
jgi:hypothetical protein